MNKGWPHGAALTADKKKWRYFSPSTLMAGDPGTSEGCLRRVYYEKVKELKGPEQKWLTTGKDLHAENELYLQTGDRSHMGSLALSGIHMLPKPFTIDPRIMIEHEIGGTLETAPLRAAGIPVAGYIDCIHWQGTNAGTMDIEDTHDPEGTVEVIDWKTTSNEKYIKSAQEVSRTLQMTIYGKWALVTGDVANVRLSHGYYITKGRNTPRKVSLRVHRDQIDERWEYVEHLASSLVEVVKEDNPDKVPANTRACDAYRGCPHRSYCSAASHNSLASHFGTDFAASLLGLDQSSVLTLPSESTPNMSLLAKLQAATTPATTGPKPEVAMEMKRLALEEVTVKYPGIADVIARIEASGLGLPVLLGEAARVYAIIKGAAPYACGDLAGFEFIDPNDLASVAAEAEVIAAQRTASGAPATATVTAVSAAVMGEMIPVGQMKAMLDGQSMLNPFPEDAPPALASPPEDEKPVITNATEAIELAAGETKKKKAGRPKKAVETSPQVDEQAVLIEVADAQRTTNVNSEDSQEIVAHVAAINLFVDCIPSVKYQSFWPFVDEVTKTMTNLYGGVDYRTADNDKATSFGKWKGYLAHGLRTLATAGQIPPGNYILDNSMTETGGVIVEAMREIVAQSGGMLVRGIR